jgi:hypothetical protein
MKRILIASVALLMAGSLFAGEDKPQQTTTTPDSPLVAAAKASKRTNKKKRVVITNDTLKNSTGHVSVSTASPTAMKLPNAPDTAGQTAADKQAKEAATTQAAEKAKADKTAAEAKQKETQRAAQAEDDGPYHDPRPPDAPKKPEEKKP